MTQPMTPKQLCDAIGRGGQATVARWIGSSRSKVNYWYKNLEQVPLEYCKKIEEESEGRFPRHQLRPDAFDAP